MIGNIGTVALTILGLALSLTAAANPAPAVAGGGVAAPQLLKADTLTKQQFEQQLKRLPDNAVIESKGQRMTMAQIRALAAQKGQQHSAKAQAALIEANAIFERHRAQLEQQHQAKLRADNAKAIEEFKRLP